jgi:CDP-2,3-bis-(O-geranylgeranyl)-sn-glycerol synthase
MNAVDLNPFACAAFLIAAFTFAGACQTAWLAAPASRRFAMPLDGGRTLGGRRLLGDNKTIRGFIVIVPAASLAFGLLAWLMVTSPAGLAGLWSLTPVQYALLGAWGALGFMAGELPNSFVKRRLGIRPGAAAEGHLRAPLFSVVDRIDSIVGLMLALMVVVPVPWGTWLCVVLVGPALHGLFSVALFRLGVKVRPA